MFDDRRQRIDRRVRRDPAGIPATGCRRLNERRNRARRYQAHPWWLQATYVEEVEPPELQLETDVDRKRRISLDLGPAWLLHPQPVTA